VRVSDEAEAETAAPASAMSGLCRAVLTGVPGGAAVVFDHELRVRLSEGEAMARAGTGPMVGRLLHDLLRVEAWDAVRGPYEAAIVGRTTRFDLATRGTLFSIHVAPIALPGNGRGGLAVSYAVSAQRRLEAEAVARDEAESSEALLRSAFDRAPIGMTVIGADGRWLRVNDAWCRMLGYAREELMGAKFSEFKHPDDALEDHELLTAAVASSGETLTREKRYLHKDGSDVWVDLRSEMIRSRSGEPLYVVAHLLDISERRMAQEQRRASDRTLHAIVDNTPAVICVKGQDLRYQLVNRQFEDWCGVPSDLILGRSAEEMPWGPLVADGRVKDELVLDGGEPFQEEETVLSHGQPRVFLTSRFPLLDERGQIHAVCSTSTDVTEHRDEERLRRERLQCSVQVHAALAQDRLVLLGQPILNLRSMQIEQAELLLRMRRTRGGSYLMPPKDFLPAAERFGMIGLIDEWVVDRAVEHAAAGHRVEVNLSALTISDVAQVDRIERAVLASGAPPANLIFEITETAAADHLDAAREFARRLRKLGCAFALDDFGVGHGTFTYLKHLPVDYLKIDIQFVRDLVSDDSDGDVVQAIIGVAKQFGIETIAEGVEDQATLLELQRIGADYAQGYWIGRPAGLDQLWNPSTPKES
jgi:PAS domain S-box-containing protein